jgi:FMN-dependent NADH-azoreductase
MTTILVVTSSALGEASVSSGLVRNTITELRRKHPDAQLVLRDLGADPVPHLTIDAATAMRAEPANLAQEEARKLSDELIAELKAADIMVFGVPMYNFGIPSTLKAWFDYILRAGVTFRYTENGPEGLLTGKRAMVVLTRGGLYSEGPASTMDAQEPHLSTLLGFVGMTDVTVIRAERLAMGPEPREHSIEPARSLIAEAVRAWPRRPAFATAAE